MTVARSLLLLLLYESWQEGEVMMIWLRQNEAWHLTGEYWFLITFTSNKKKHIKPIKRFRWSVVF